VRYWNVEEARAFLPRLRVLLESIQELASRPVRAASNGHAQLERDESRPGARESLEELERNDIILRDPATGIVDFRALGDDGTEYLLCWRPEDGDLGWWHLPDEGFARRKPLPRRAGPGPR
jgi:hypothetical protein